MESRLSDTARNDGGFGSTNKLIEEVSDTTRGTGKFGSSGKN